MHRMRHLPRNRLDRPRLFVLPVDFIAFLDIHTHDSHTFLTTSSSARIRTLCSVEREILSVAAT